MLQQPSPANPARICSMTGYADLDRRIGGVCYFFSARSVNHRTLDVSVKVPPQFSHAAHKVAELAKAALRRGRVAVTVARAGGEARLELDEQNVRALRRARKRLRKFGLRVRDPSLAELASLGEMLRGGKSADKDTEAFLAAARELAGQLRESRAKEGAQMHAFMDGEAKQANSIVSEFVANAGAMRAHVRDRMLRRLGAEDQAGLSPAARDEVAVGCAKADVTEEIDRLQVHLAELGTLLGRGGPVGRNLDFVLQEIRRESGTLTAKLVQPELAHQAMRLSLLAESMREQAQNVE